ncbi:MAG: tRNA (5-methylaminomethyl-2-thiouridine)(34)-methyltransferase MnmD [Bacteroidales bacterium]|nr:tRNA (5-methylaminomethyl-2-thiouridine)(34)-methyltransferase MnmD [Bacteroidales bacterium]
MKPKITPTRDGSATLYSPEFNDHYHSVFGAINESRHVFIEAGFNQIHSTSIKLFEVGFGTGLNALLTFLEGLKREVAVEYSAIELYPLSTDTIQQLSTCLGLSNEDKELFIQIHQAEWNRKIRLSSHFQLQKIHGDFNNYPFTEKYDLIFFDAFAPEKQPDLWSTDNFIKIYQAMNTQGILTTYSSKGIVKQAIRKAGFHLQRMAGPSGKRHMLRAIKEHP